MAKKVLSEIETERDLDWLKKLLTEELELSPDEWLSVLTVGIITLARRGTHGMVAIWHNVLVGALAIYNVKHGLEETTDTGCPALEARWRDLWNKINKYWILMGRFPKGVG